MKDAPPFEFIEVEKTYYKYTLKVNYLTININFERLTSQLFFYNALSDELVIKNFMNMTFW